jgi:hypothetical protein
MIRSILVLALLITNAYFPAYLASILLTATTLAWILVGIKAVLLPLLPVILSGGPILSDKDSKTPPTYYMLLSAITSCIFSATLYYFGYPILAFILWLMDALIIDSLQSLRIKKCKLKLTYLILTLS